jgi:hypothetical protein
MTGTVFPLRAELSHMRFFTTARSALRSALLALIATVTLTGASSILEPVVVVYPFTVSGATDPEAGSHFANLFAERIAQGGGVLVKPPIPGTKRPDFFTTARGEGADYYISGYVTPLGSEAAVVEQIVSASSGIVVWSNTVQIETYADALSQGDVMHNAILSHAGRSFSSLNAPRGTPPAGSGPANTTKTSLGSLFGNRHTKHNTRAQASSTPSGSASPQ